MSGTTLTLTGLPATQTTTDVASIDPFAAVSLTDTSGGSYDVFVVVQQPGDGTLSYPPAPADVSSDGSTVALAGTAAQVQAELQQLVYTPAVQGTPGQATTTGLSLEFEDSNDTLLASYQTQITADSVADALTIQTLPINVVPALYGTGAPYAFTPFTNVAITDLTPGAMDSTTITLDVNGVPSDANGTLAGTGLTETSLGVYQLAAATPATEQAELQSLVFTSIPGPSTIVTGIVPGGGPTSTQAMLQVSNGVSAPATDQYPIDTTGFVVAAVDLSSAFYHPASLTTTQASAAAQAYSTTILAILDGTQTVYNQTFALPYAEPTVQQAVARAAADLENDGAAPSQPALTRSDTTNSTSTTVTPTGTTSGSVGTTTTFTNGPNTIGSPNEYFPIAGIGAGYYTIPPGQENINVTTILPYTSSQTITTTTTNLLTQTYTITGSNAAECFRAGTRIRTPRGEVAIETLRVGDILLTAQGRAAAVRWLGRRQVDCGRHPQPGKVWPYRIAPGAFGPGLPHRTLWLSPGHAVAIDGVLIPIERLANGTTVAQMRTESVTYWHVELDRHDILLAEGLPAESYLDTGDRGSFDSADLIALPAERRPRRVSELWDALAAAPLCITGPSVERVRQRLACFAAGGTGPGDSCRPAPRRGSTGPSALRCSLHRQCCPPAA
jgi:hypothetical protein